MMSSQPQSLFGGNMSMYLPSRAKDISSLREVPDNQEVFAHDVTDQSVIVELLQYVEEGDQDAIRTHFEELAASNSALGADQSRIVSVEQLAINTLSMRECGSAYLVLGQQSVSKFKEAARNVINVWLCLYRLPHKHTDVLLSFNDPLSISPQSSSHSPAPPNNAHAWTPDEFKQCVHSLTLHNPDFLL